MSVVSAPTSPVPAGVYLPQIRMPYDVIEQRVRCAEDLGFHSAWFMDHLAPPAMPDSDCFEGWTLVTALAARTERIRLGHLVLCDAFRHPAVLAKMATSLDVISNGRLDLGIGWGSVAAELQQFGITSDGAGVRARRLRETIELLRLLSSGEPTDYDGEFVRTRGATMRPRSVQDRIPVHVGGAGERLTLPLARDLADWWNCPSYAADRLPELRELVGPGPRVSVQHPVGLAASSAAREETEAVARKRFGGWGGLVVGTPDEVASRLAAEREHGVELWILQFSDFGRPETLELFAREVAPALAG